MWSPFDAQIAQEGELWRFELKLIVEWESPFPHASSCELAVPSVHALGSADRIGFEATTPSI
jgi:hypothetical protein